MPARAFYSLRAGFGVNSWAGRIFYLWSPTGQLPDLVTGSYSFDPALSLLPPTWYGNWQFINNYVMAFKVGDSAVVGDTYPISWADDGYAEVTIIDDPTPNNPYLIPPASTFSDVAMAQTYIQTAIDLGYSPIYLSAGDYQISTSFDLTGPYVANIVVIDGQNFASLTATSDLGVHGMFNLTKPLRLQRLTFCASLLDLSQNVLTSNSPQHVDVDITLCKFVDINLGNWILGNYYLADYDPNSGDEDAHYTGIVVDRCEFVRASTGGIPVGSVFSFCRFTETPLNSGAHAFFNYYSRKWLAVSCDWVRTARGIVIQNFSGGPVQNGVAAACRFWDIAQGTLNGGEIINLEDGTNVGDSITNNAFVWCHAYNCGGAGIELSGGGIHHNSFYSTTMDTRAASIYLANSVDTSPIHHNSFYNLEIGADMTITGHCHDNSFYSMIANRQALRNSNETPGYRESLVILANNSARLPFMDISTHNPVAGEGPNTFEEIYEARYDGIFKVFRFLNTPVTGA